MKITETGEADNMLGAFVGDIVGSVYEWDNINTKEFELFTRKKHMIGMGYDQFFTDDSVMTAAIAQGLMNGGRAEDYIAAMQAFGRKYPGRGYGGRFAQWLKMKNPQPYNSWGNGSAMRVSPVAWAFDTLEDVLEAAEVCTKVTHDHPEGIKGAKATAAAIFLARKGVDKQAIRDHIESEYGYDLNRTIDEIRPVYFFNESCQRTVPEAIIAFLESVDFEDALRNAISLGGDSDTLAAITCSIAEAAYGVPEEIKRKTMKIIPNGIKRVYSAFLRFTDR